MALPVYHAEQIRKWDAYTIQHEPIESVDLMERAGKACAERIQQRLSKSQSITIFAGVGNNGGDGLVIGRLLIEKGYTVHIFIVEFSSNYSNDFQENLNKLKPIILPIYLKKDNHTFSLDTNTVVVDAIFGTGLTRKIEADWLLKIIRKINGHSGETISIDLPSGLFCDDNSGHDLEGIVKAGLTLTFQAPKMPFFFKNYYPCVGDFEILNIGLHQEYKAITKYNYTQLNDILLIRKDKFSHKGSNGHALLVGGYENMFGSISLSAKAALKSGCGYVYVKMNRAGQSVLLSQVLEAVIVDDISLVTPKVKAIGIGPGLGMSDDSLEVLSKVFKLNKPTVIDADAINLLAKHEFLLEFLPKHAIITPHLKELNRLLGTFGSEEQLLAAQVDFSKRYGVYIIQKGAYSKLTTPDGGVFFNSTGNQGMAVAGMGDVLTGIITAFLAQGYSAETSAKYGMLIHGTAGDSLKEKLGLIGYLPSDLIKELPKIINTIYNKQYGHN